MPQAPTLYVLLSDSTETLYLLQGRVVEAGSHGELLAAGGKYAELWQRQHVRVDDVYDSADEFEAESAGMVDSSDAGKPMT